MNRIMKRMALPVGAAIVLGSSGFAFMASNVQHTSSAGYSSESINGYTVNSIHYNACLPMNGNYCSVEFLLKPTNGLFPPNTGTNVQASVNGGTFHTCSYEGAPGSNNGQLWRCAVDVGTADLTSLQISAAQ